MNYSTLSNFILKCCALILATVIAQPCLAQPLEQTQTPNQQTYDGARGLLNDDSWVYQQPIPKQAERELPTKNIILWGLDELLVYGDDSVDIRERKSEQVQAVMVEKGVDPLHFASGFSKVGENYAEQWDKLLKQFSDHKNIRVHITGHTDSQKLSARARQRYKDNYGLGKARAVRAGQFFIDTLSLSPESISYDSKGPDEPIASNATSEGMELNRRVEVQVWYDEVTHSASVEQTGAPLCDVDKVAGTEAMVAVPFRISIDGQPQTSAAMNMNRASADQQRCTDVELERANIQIQYDNLSQPRWLSVNASDRTVDLSHPIRFQAHSNYLFWIDRAEILIMDRAQKMVATLVLDAQLRAQWTPIEKKLPRQLFYQVRVYDDEGRYDETTLMPLRFVRERDYEDNEDEKKHVIENQTYELAAGYGENHLQHQRIPVEGGVVTINGREIPDGHHVIAMGKPVAVSTEHSFVMQQIIPRGLHKIEVAVLDAQGAGRIYRRDLRLPANDWFTIAIADLTLGQNKTKGPAQLVNAGDYHYDEDRYLDGRLAFYTKGKTKSGYTITGSADTGNEEFKDLFTNIDEKNPQAILRRMDAKQHWPVFGDDSTLIEDAPTQGKFYLRADKGHSHALWGNFKEQQSDTELTQIDRALYGAQLHYADDQFTTSGEHRLQVDAVAAEPGTISTREDFRGTGGSVFFLRHQDVTQGSERVRIEVRDKDSGLVLHVNNLSAGTNYQIDSIQGRVLLTSPLASVAGDSQLVRASSITGHPAYLVVAYEYTPGFANTKDLVTSGRAAYWLNDTVKLGISSSRQKEFDQTQNLSGIDITLRKNADTWLKAEMANSDGTGLDHQTSDDGGFGFNQVDRGGGDANANRIEAAFVFSDLFGEKKGSKEEGRGTFYIENREDGFSAPGRLTRGETEKFGASVTAPLSDDTELTLKLDDTSNDQSGDLSVVEINLAHSLNERWLIGAGLRADDREGTSIDSGAREDLAVQMKYLSAEDWSLWGFTQATLHRDDERERNHRAGVGGIYQIAEQAALNGEISAGDMGLGIVGGIDYQWSDRTSIYSNYQLDNDRTDNGARSRNGQFVFGVRNRWSDSVNVYAEGRRLSGGQGSGLMQGYGINYAPTDAWSYGLGMEHGDINQEADNEIERLAITASMGYTDAGKRYSGILEYRDDKSDAEDRSVWLVRNNYSSQVSQDWRAIIHLDAAISESNLGDVFDADFAEASLGYAYRPVSSDWLNALVKYTYLYDLAPDEQFNTTDVSTVDYAQRSQVVAGDVTVDLSPRWSLGGKYAYRLGELRPSRDDSADWFESKGELFILRADWHVVHAWDVTLEWRLRNEISANDSRHGWLVAGYRHFGEHFKAGVGYNFSNFSDDLTDLDYEAGGWFLNAVGKY